MQATSTCAPALPATTCFGPASRQGCGCSSRPAAHPRLKDAARVCCQTARGRRRLVLVRGSDGSSGSDADQPESAIPDTLPVAGVDSDWRTFRAKLVAASAAVSSSSSSQMPAAQGTAAGAWAHSLPYPEQGCLLLANPLMFQTSQTYFYLSVILVYGHDERGSVGLILNRPTEYKVADISGTGADALQPELSSCQLYLGGDVAPDSMYLLHGVRGLGGCAEILPGVYLGGFQNAKAGIAEGRLSPNEFKVLTRCAGWAPGQLEAECRRGVWLPVSASAAAVLSPPAHATANVPGMWHYIAQLAGGDLAALSREVQGVANPEIQQAAGGSYQQPEENGQDEADEGSSGGSSGSSGSGGSGGGGSQWQQQQQRRRSKLPETDYRDGAGI